MKEHASNIIGFVLTAVTIPANVIEFLTVNKIVFNIFFLIIISSLTAIYWIIKIIGRSKKDKLEIEKMKYDLIDREISCKERQLELEMKKDEHNRKI